MGRNQIELLVIYQDIHLMLQDAEKEEANIGFSMEGKEKLLQAEKEMEKNIDIRYLSAYKRLATRFKHPIVPVQDGTCLGCFAKLPTSFLARGRADQSIFTCEQCGRMLYWVE